MTLFHPSQLTARGPEPGADVAYTPEGLAKHCVAHLAAELRGATCWEMHAGSGAWLAALPAARPALAYGSEVDAAAVEILANRFRGSVYPQSWDALRGTPPGFPIPDWIVGNPPWSDAADHLRVALATSRRGIAWILPWAWLVPADRSWVAEQAFIDELLPFVERVDYTGPGREEQGSPPRDSALHVWRRRLDGTWMGRGRLGRMSTRTGRVWLPGGVS